MAAAFFTFFFPPSIARPVYAGAGLREGEINLCSVNWLEQFIVFQNMTVFHLQVLNLME